MAVKANLEASISPANDPVDFTSAYMVLVDRLLSDVADSDASECARIVRAITRRSLKETPKGRATLRRAPHLATAEAVSRRVLKARCEACPRICQSPLR
ncbi:hypothetical protein OVA11_19165 [Caulobacter sp. SL161]|uniref:hypothetical protein n=1 Tax=Caulobacter sp. SL161 TaxID=2995156 RepID=UPI0022767FD2|nr:hypothetical protein [Caulobacter sp. SL161]MCY1649099.1 hypothetical protein [Caulobacter sp. SL161]